jgi:hypothetical protein
VNRPLSIFPAYLLLVAANALPVIGAATGRLVFFQALYLYWFESLLLIVFDGIRIATAQGSRVDGTLFNKAGGCLRSRFAEQPGEVVMI